MGTLTKITRQRSFFETPKLASTPSKPIPPVGNETSAASGLSDKSTSSPSSPLPEKSPPKKSRRDFSDDLPIELPADLPPAAPCPACGSPLWWLDIYGGGPHCEGCQPSPARALVAHRLYVLVVAGWDDEAGKLKPGAVLAWIDWRDTPAGRRRDLQHQ